MSYKNGWDQPGSTETNGTEGWGPASDMQNGLENGHTEEPDQEPVAPAAETRTHKFGSGSDLPPVDEEARVWFGTARRWEEGEVDETLEQELYEKNKVNTGINFEQLGHVPIKVAGEDVPPLLESFDDIKLHEGLKYNITSLMKYNKPTPIQKAAIPILASRRDLMACAQTGSGKTAAYLIPIINRMLLLGKEKLCPKPTSMFDRHAKPLVLIISPTRELACQIFDECRKFSYKSWIKPAVLYGGANTRSLMQNVERGCHILAATPGKLLDMIDRNRVSLQYVKWLVIDEADRLLELGFEQEIRRIVQQHMSADLESRQTALFSATFPKNVRRIAREFLGDCLLVTVGRVGTVPTDITQTILKVDDFDKRRALLDLLYEQEAGLTLIFVNTCRATDTLDDYLHNNSFPVTSVHSGRNQAEREDALSAFRAARKPIMIATDLAARGLDIPNVVHVINYDMPKNIDDYIHRIGRTARVGNKGAATSFFNDNNSDIATDLVRVLRETEQTVPEFLNEYRPDYEETPDSPENGIVDELKEEDLEGDLPDGYAPLGQQVASGNDDDATWGNAGVDGGGKWGQADSTDPVSTHEDTNEEGDSDQPNNGMSGSW
ncbi:uncharacterized protein SPPG_06626 [Spizellomyces punctatus DAOM BR117]|uniref:ATP-dependent RNA helicase DED1 n=1 Tax=Spizellomyces punctatus (strain DAOM BR117) TaxID=645134 RepID=A0A0L0HBB9_SPIPD|nr:uncharacterized protein SPPG_06626 [Spizellomyces punctatus DAOM BR117]KNC98226.1 hypothetical protein SPPG_06626 [Spizellomyces punctatus DAOM BR117]|eukprot:XP_016606266.1 hypothetical protein SPPG_06626 [Spizellomyces punctatus DAOM BR117]